MKKTSLGELIANAVSHGVGLLLAITGLIILLVQADTTLETISSLIFGIAMIILYLSSTLFHSFPEKMKRVFTVFQRLDHSSIFLLISGTYTPFLILVVNDWKGYVLLAVLWAMTIVGIVFKSIWIHRFKLFHLVMYLMMGWSIIFVLPEVLNSMTNLTFLILGGLSYTGGVAFYLAKFKYAHFVWHIFVLAGTIFHFFAVLQIL